MPLHASHGLLPSRVPQAAAAAGLSDSHSPASDPHARAPRTALSRSDRHARQKAAACTPPPALCRWSLPWLSRGGGERASVAPTGSLWSVAPRCRHAADALVGRQLRGLVAPATCALTARGAVTIYGAHECAPVLAAG
eukprot:6191463-Pleurochrysis_carterae.AAC.1